MDCNGCGYSCGNDNYSANSEPFGASYHSNDNYHADALDAGYHKMEEENLPHTKSSDFEEQVTKEFEEATTEEESQVIIKKIDNKEEVKHHQRKKESVKPVEPKSYDNKGEVLKIDDLVQKIQKPDSDGAFH